MSASSSSVSSSTSPVTIEAFAKASAEKIPSIKVRLQRFIVKFENGKMDLFNITTNKQFSTQVQVRDASKTAFLTSWAFLGNDLVEFIETLKKIKSVYAGVFSEPLKLDHSILAINCTFKEIATSGDLIGIQCDNLGKIEAQGTLFLRNCPSHKGIVAPYLNIDTSVPMIGVQAKGILRRYVLPEAKEALFEYARTEGDIIVMGHTKVRLVNCRVRSVQFIEKDGKTRCSGTVVSEGRTIISHPELINGTIITGSKI